MPDLYLSEPLAPFTKKTDITQLLPKGTDIIRESLMTAGEAFIAQQNRSTSDSEIANLCRLIKNNIDKLFHLGVSETLPDIYKLSNNIKVIMLWMTLLQNSSWVKNLSQGKGSIDLDDIALLRIALIALQSIIVDVHDEFNRTWSKIAKGADNAIDLFIQLKNECKLAFAGLYIVTLQQKLVDIYNERKIFRTALPEPDLKEIEKLRQSELNITSAITSPHADILTSYFALTYVRSLRDKVNYKSDVNLQFFIMHLASLPFAQVIQRQQGELYYKALAKTLMKHFVGRVTAKTIALTFSYSDAIARQYAKFEPQNDDEAIRLIEVLFALSAGLYQFAYEIAELSKGGSPSPYCQVVTINGLSIIDNLLILMNHLELASSRYSEVLRQQGYQELNTSINSLKGLFQNFLINKLQRLPTYKVVEEGGIFSDEKKEPISEGEMIRLIDERIVDPYELMAYLLNNSLTGDNSLQLLPSLRSQSQENREVLVGTDGTEINSISYANHDLKLQILRILLVKTQKIRPEQEILAYTAMMTLANIWLKKAYLSFQAKEDMYLGFATPAELKTEAALVTKLNDARRKRHILYSRGMVSSQALRGASDKQVDEFFKARGLDQSPVAFHRRFSTSWQTEIVKILTSFPKQRFIINDKGNGDKPRLVEERSDSVKFSQTSTMQEDALRAIMPTEEVLQSLQTAEQTYLNYRATLAAILPIKIAVESVMKDNKETMAQKSASSVDSPSASDLTLSKYIQSRNNMIVNRQQEETEQAKRKEKPALIISKIIGLNKRAPESNSQALSLALTDYAKLNKALFETRQTLQRAKSAEDKEKTVGKVSTKTQGSIEKATQKIELLEVLVSNFKSTYVRLVFDLYQEQLSRLQEDTVANSPNNIELAHVDTLAKEWHSLRQALYALQQTYHDETAKIEAAKKVGEIVSIVRTVKDTDIEIAKQNISEAMSRLSESLQAYPQLIWSLSSSRQAYIDLAKKYKLFTTDRMRLTNEDHEGKPYDSELLVQFEQYRFSQALLMNEGEKKEKELREATNSYYGAVLAIGREQYRAVTSAIDQTLLSNEAEILELHYLNYAFEQLLRINNRVLNKGLWEKVCELRQTLASRTDLIIPSVSGLGSSRAGTSHSDTGPASSSSRTRSESTLSRNPSQTGGSASAASQSQPSLTGDSSKRPTPPPKTQSASALSLDFPMPPSMHAGVNPLATRPSSSTDSPFVAGNLLDLTFGSSPPASLSHGVFPMFSLPEPSPMPIPFSPLTPLPSSGSPSVIGAGLSTSSTAKAVLTAIQSVLEELEKDDGDITLFHSSYKLALFNLVNNKGVVPTGDQLTSWLENYASQALVPSSSSTGSAAKPYNETVLIRWSARNATVWLQATNAAIASIEAKERAEAEAAERARQEAEALAAARAQAEAATRAAAEAAAQKQAEQAAAQSIATEPASSTVGSSPGGQPVSSQLDAANNAGGPNFVPPPPPGPPPAPAVNAVGNTADRESLLAGIRSIKNETGGTASMLPSKLKGSFKLMRGTSSKDNGSGRKPASPPKEAALADHLANAVTQRRGAMDGTKDKDETFTAWAEYYKLVEAFPSEPKDGKTYIKVNEDNTGFNYWLSVHGKKARTSQGEILWSEVTGLKGSVPMPLTTEFLADNYEALELCRKQKLGKGMNDLGRSLTPPAGGANDASSSDSTQPSPSPAPEPVRQTDTFVSFYQGTDDRTTVMADEDNLSTSPKSSS